MKLFSTSGIRRKVSQLSPEFVSRVGLGIAKALCNNVNEDIPLARDARLSGPMLENAVTAGLIAGGCNVIKKGIMPTPALAYHTHKMNSPTGIMITASHNPPEYNGIKVFDSTSMGLSPEDEEKIELVVASKELGQVDWQKFGRTKEELGSKPYEEMLLNAGSGINIEKFNQVVADPGGGAGCQIVSETYRKIGLKMLVINGVFDPYFSARPSEPVEKNLTTLIDFMKKETEKGNTIGLAYDGDADRCLAIDEKGRYVEQDVLISLYSRFIVEQNNGKGLIVTHVDASMLLDKLVTKAGGKVKRTKVGDVAIGNMVAKENAIFGGEPCGAWIHPKYHLCPDGPLTGLKILEWISEVGSLSALVDDVQDYPVFREKISCKNEVKSLVMKSLDESLSAKDDYKDILRIDGLRISFEDDSWVLIRPSGTEPFIRVTSQAMTEKDSKNRLELYSKLVNQEINRIST